MQHFGESVAPEHFSKMLTNVRPVIGKVFALKSVNLDPFKSILQKTSEIFFVRAYVVSEVANSPVVIRDLLSKLEGEFCSYLIIR